MFLLNSKVGVYGFSDFVPSVSSGQDLNYFAMSTSLEKLIEFFALSCVLILSSRFMSKNAYCLVFNFRIAG